MTPLQWAVLTAYARSLPGGDFRQAVQAVADKHAPQPARQGAAVILADSCGLTKHGKLSRLGKLAAVKLLQVHGVQVDKLALLDAVRGERENA